MLVHEQVLHALMQHSHAVALRMGCRVQKFLRLTPNRPETWHPAVTQLLFKLGTEAPQQGKRSEKAQLTDTRLELLLMLLQGSEDTLQLEQQTQCSPDLHVAMIALKKEAHLLAEARRDGLHSARRGL